MPIKDKYAPLGVHLKRLAADHSDVTLTFAEIERIAKEVTAPLLINMVVGGLTPIQSPERLAELGYAIAIYPTQPLMGAAAAMVTGLAELAGLTGLTGPAGSAGPDPRGLLPSTPAELFGLVGLDEWSQLPGPGSLPGGGADERHDLGREQP